ncbi:AbiJ-NTD4 domain-containing protein [Zafaria sp. Z1313]|uniref:AbiJ-NTD4 domain-containing protein n=1 Tax=Zafaria sp. Z1313 TaxID=3423202 RepID=UPI003D302E0B
MPNVGRFSERHGYAEPRSTLQVHELDKETRVALWDVVYMIPFAQTRGAITSQASHFPFCRALWQFWGEPQSELQGRFVETLSLRAQRSIYEKPFYEVMDLLEFCIDNAGDRYQEVLNLTFGKYLVGWRVVGDQIVPVTEAGEVGAIEDALESTAPFAGARKHLEVALDLLADRENPKYAKVVHEAISAVEAIATHYTGEKTLGAALKKLEGSGVPAHRALTDAWGKLYGYTSDENGVRHGSVEDNDVDEALATYFLVTCSAFVGYLIKKAGQ